jgi:hypothetical protein
LNGPRIHDDAACPALHVQTLRCINATGREMSADFDTKKGALPIARHAISDVRKCSVGSVLRFLRIRH